MAVSGKILDGFSRGELVLLGSAMLFSLGVSYLIWSDYSLIGGQFQAKGLPIAAVEDPSNVVKRRPAGVPVWNEVMTAEELYQYDQIYTDSNSTVRIRFNSDDEIEISENALVVIERYDDMASVNVKRGVVLATAKSDSPLFRVRAGASSTVFKQAGTQAIIEANQSGSEVSVTEGQAEVQTKTDTITVEKDRRVKVQQGRATLEKPPVTLDVPTLGVGAKGGSPARKITWSNAQSGSGYLLEVASDADFKNVVHRVRTNQTSGELPEDLRGSFFVRAGTMTQEGVQYSVRKRVSIRPMIPPRLKWPPQGKAFQQTNGEFTTFLSWEEEVGERAYEVQLSRSVDFDQILVSEVVDSSPLQTPSLAPGSYFARVRTIGEAGQTTDWSGVRKFSVKQEEPSALAEVTSAEMPVVSEQLSEADLAPEDKPEAVIKLEQPDTGLAADDQADAPVATASPAKLKRLPDRFVPQLIRPNADSILVGNADGSAANVTFAWQAVKGADRYEIQIGTEKNFTQLADELMVTQSKAAVNLTPGRYFWRVRTGRGSFFSRWSEAARFRQRRPLPAPRIVADQVDAGKIAPDKPRLGLKWKEVERARAYDLEISKDPAFQKPVLRRKSTSLAYAGALPAGEYYSRVRAVENTGLKGLWSEPVKVAVVEPNLLKSPVPETPAPAERFIYRKHLPRVMFAWDIQEFARAYEIQVARDKSFTDLALNTSIKGTETSFPLRKGQYYWRVRAKRPKEVGPWTAMREFTVEKNTSRPELTFPGKEIEVNFDETERRSLDVTWEQADDLTNLVLLVSRDPGFTQPIGRLNVKGHSTKILIKEDGKYYIQVRGKDKRENVAVRSEYSSFTVTTTEIEKPKYVEDTFRIEALYTPNRLEYSHNDAAGDNLNFTVNFKRSYQLALRGWFNSDWGFEMEFSRKWADVVVEVESEDVAAQRPFFDIVETGGAFRRRWSVWQSSFPVDLGLRFGYHYQPLFTFFSNGESGTYGLVSSDAHSLLAGFETRVPLGGSYNLETKIDYIQLLAADPVSVSKSTHYLVNSTLVGQFFRYMSMSLGAFYRSQSYTYEDAVNEATGDFDAEFLGLLYGLGYVF